MKLGPAINIEAALKRPSIRNRIYRIGVELEGGWETLPEGSRLAHDGSVKVSRPISEKVLARYAELNTMSARGALTAPLLTEYKRLYNAINKGNDLQVGEMPSPVMEMDEKSSLYWPAWVAKYYPSHVNETCGMHVHLSVPPKRTIRYSRLMTPSYGATVIEEFKKWATTQDNLKESHSIWARLAGECEYCQHTFFAEEQVKLASKDYDHHRVGNRYSVINYCYSRLGTLECRLLPMFETSTQAIAAIKQLLLITNAFLLTTGGAREEKIESTWIIDDDHYKEEMIECV